MAKLKYMINNLESSILILHQELASIKSWPYSIYNGRSSISKNLCSKSTHKSIKTQLIEHRIEWKAIIITLIEMSGRKRYFRVILAEFLRIGRLRSDLCNSYKKSGVLNNLANNLASNRAFI